MRDQDQEYVRDRLEALGFAVDVIEASTDKRPDLLAQSGGDRVFVEVKSRRFDAALRDAMEGVPPGASQVVETELRKHNTISGEIKAAVRQLDALAKAADFRFLWYRANRGLFVQGAFEQISATLLGTRHVRTESGRLRPCAYAGFSDFFRFRTLDAVVVEVDERISLFPNHFSPRYARLTASGAWSAFPAHSVRDVQKAANLCGWLMVDGASDRKNDVAVLAHLQLKYPDERIVAFETPTAATHITTIDAREELRKRDERRVSS